MLYYVYMTQFSDTQKLIDYCKTHDIAYLGVFGSAARGELTGKSDIDLLVRYKNDNAISLLTHVGIQIELKDLLGRDVDLITEDSISPYIRPYIEKDLKTIYGQRSVSAV